MTHHPRIRRTAIVAVLALGLAASAAWAAPQNGSAGNPAGPQLINTTSLAVAQIGNQIGSQATVAAMATATPAAVPLAGALVMQAHATVLRPAPVPDPDLDAPGPSRQALADQDQASLQPSFYSSARRGFSGDGFATGSTLDDDHANRRRPAGGMSLSIPVQ